MGPFLPLSIGFLAPGIFFLALISVYFVYHHWKQHWDFISHLQWVQTIRAVSAGTIWFVLVLVCTAKIALDISATFNPGAHAVNKGLLQTINLCWKP